MKPVDVKSNTYIDSSKEINDKDPKFKVGHIVRISKYKSIFAKGQVQIWCEEVFLLNKGKNTVLQTALSVILKAITKSKSKRVSSWKSNKKAINYMFNGKVILGQFI